MPVVNGTCRKGKDEKMNLTFGLVNSAGKYLTGESFGFKINANGTALRKKQIWTLEQEAGQEGGYLKSPQGRYLAADKNGNMVCDIEEKEEDAKFEIEVQKDGRWGIKSKYGHYMVGSGDTVVCSGRKPDDKSVWAVHLALHPQVNLKSVSRKRHLHLTGDEVHADEDIPWGKDAVVTLEFLGTKYALRTADGNYLNKSGKLVAKVSTDCELVLEFYDNFVAFRDEDGHYLCPYGPRGKIQAGKKETISSTKDELYEMGDSHAQCVLIANNGRKVSIKQGCDVTANQDEHGDTETFQMEFVDGLSDKVAFKTNTNKYWSLDGKGAGVTAKIPEITNDAKFDIEWHDNKIALKANNGKYLCPKSAGHLAATSDSAAEKEQFVFGLVNRPLLILRGDLGYFGLRSGTAKVECNRGRYDVFELIFEDDFYYVKSKNNLFWELDDSSVLNATGTESGDKFSILLREPSRLCIKAIKNGCYLQGDQSGTVKAKSSEIVKGCLWEH